MRHFYQVGAHPACPKIALHFCVCWLISLCVSTLITCAIIMSYIVAMRLTLVGLTAALSTGVATMSRLAEATLMQWCEAD